MTPSSSPPRRYRPDLMAFIVVGDPDAMEQTIRDVFSSLPTPATERARETFPVPDNDAPLYAIVSDHENPYNVVMLAFKTEAPHYANTDDYRRYLAGQLYQQLLNLRLNELTRQANPPFIAASTSFGHFMVRPKGAYMINTVVADNGIGARPRRRAHRRASASASTASLPTSSSAARKRCCAISSRHISTGTRRSPTA